MVLEIELNTEAVTTLERFLNTNTYKELAESTMSFNRKLNEERKMRIPYIDGQTGVAQKHYDNHRSARERMPGRQDGQVYTYPQRAWRKKRYQYLQYFMLPKHLRYEPESEVYNTGLVGVELPQTNNEDSNGNTSSVQEKVTQWETIYEDEYSMPEAELEPESDDSDFEFDGVRTKKGKAKKGRIIKPAKPKPDPNARRRTHADNIPDSEKPFACDLCLARYKTRPGLTYHYNHSHKEKDVEGYQLPESDELEGRSLDSPSAGSDSLDGPLQARGSSYQHQAFPNLGMAMEEDMRARQDRSPGHMKGIVRGVSPTHARAFSQGINRNQVRKPIPGAAAGPGMPQMNKVPAEPSGYCDFCLGDSSYNKKSLQPEELIGCSECGRSGHPTCLQFTRNMMISVRKYPWQCIECKTCTLCGTSENDDQLLFCDDCDRGYHMYCLVPPMKIAPEGSWSCQICVETFHKK